MLTVEQLQTYTVDEIEKCLQGHGESINDYPEMPKQDRSLVPEIGNRLIHDELNYNIKTLAEEHHKLMSRMIDEQRGIYDAIMNRVQERKPSIFFLYGYGRTRKTYLWRSMAAASRSKGEIVITVASSRTAHSRFCIPLDIHETSSCTITPDSDLAKLIARAKLIILDEAPILHRHCFEAIDRALRDVLRSYNGGKLDIPFGGKVVVLGGDFRQILLVIPKGTQQEVVHATINSSYLWDYCEVHTLNTNMRLLSGSSGSNVEEMKAFGDWILGIGDGSVGESNDVHILLDVSQDLLIPSNGDPLAAIVNSTYPDLFCYGDDMSYFKDRAILAPTNAIVELVNEYMLSLMPGDEKTYLSCDSKCSADSNVCGLGDVHTLEFLNTITASGLPNYTLKLKVGVPVMLLRNVDYNLGLCNGTQLIITRLGKYVLEAKVISGSNVGDKVFIPKLSLTPFDKRIPFSFQRRQFPLVVSFAMTINKSQGYSLNHVGVYLPQSVFSMASYMLLSLELLQEMGSEY